MNHVHVHLEIAFSEIIRKRKKGCDQDCWLKTLQNRRLTYAYMSIIETGTFYQEITLSYALDNHMHTFVLHASFGFILLNTQAKEVHFHARLSVSTRLHSSNEIHRVSLFSPVLPGLPH